MAIQNNIVIGGQITIASGYQRSVTSLADNYTTSGSNFITNNANIATGSWQILDQGSDTNFRYGWFTNTDATSSVKLAINSAGTASYAAFLMPGDVAIIPNIGTSVTLFAQATGSNSPIVLQYTCIES